MMTFNAYVEFKLGIVLLNFVIIKRFKQTIYAFDKSIHSLKANEITFVLIPPHQKKSFDLNIEGLLANFVYIIY